MAAHMVYHNLLLNDKKSQIALLAAKYTGKSINITTCNLHDSTEHVQMSISGDVAVGD